VFFKGSVEQPPKTAEAPVPTVTTKERISRKPELVEVTSPKLYVGNLSFDAAESDLFELFKGVGQVRNAEVVCHKYTQRSKGFGFVQMTTIEEARRAVQELHDKEFLGRKLVVSGAKTPDMERAA
jgi:RNA recognition motif-containing protein